MPGVTGRGCHKTAGTGVLGGMDPATEAFVAHRNLLFIVAYEMLGSAADAELADSVSARSPTGPGPTSPRAGRAGPFPRQRPAAHSRRSSGR